MAFIPCPGIVEVEMQYTMELEFCENVYHVSVSGTIDQSALSALVTIFQNWENASASPLRSNQCALHTIRARDLTTQNAQELIHTVSPAISGTNTANPAPNNVTIATAMRTGKAGRSYRGRSFWIGVTDSMYSANNIVSALQTAILAAYGALQSSLNTASTPLVVLSRHTGGAPRGSGIGTAVTSFSMDTVMDSQRRRLPEHNRHH